MRIAIDARMYSESGVGRYISNLLTNLEKVDRDNEYYILHLSNEYDKKVYHNKNFHKVLANFKWYGVSEQIKLPKLLGRIKSDLVHFPHFNVPILYGGKFVVTIHDLIHQHFQMRRASTHDPLTYKIKQIGYTAVFRNAIKKSEKILVPSEYVKKLLVKEWSVDAVKIIVTPEAVDNKILRAVGKMSQQKSKNILDKFGINPPYIFYVGNAHPHKNVEGLIKVFLELRKKYQSLRLVLSGGDHYFWQRIKMDSRFRSPREAGGNGIVYTGFVSDEELVVLYKGAECFVMPSFEEGFGIPILEAFACGCPVISSNGGSLPEVGGDGAIYFDPHNLEDMENKIDMLLQSDSLRKELIEKGKIRVKLFSWKKLAKQTLEVYQKCGLQ